MAVILVFVIGAIGNATAKHSVSGGGSDETPAQKLAVIQTGLPADTSDLLVTDLQGAIDNLSGRCIGSQEQIAGDALVSHDDMAKKGIEESYLSILQHVDASIPTGVATQNCSELFALYVALRENGR